jgi:integrase
VRRSYAATGALERLSHPHPARAYRATHCLEAGVPVDTVSARLGHVDVRTTARYAPHAPSRPTTSPTCPTAATKPPAARVKRCSGLGR